MLTKDGWAKENMERLRNEREMAQEANKAHISSGKFTRNWAKQKWEER